MPQFVTNYRYGPPTVGTFSVGDQASDLAGTLWVCTVAGTPGTWVSNQRGAVPTGTGDLSLQSFLGNAGQSTNAALPIRSNLEWDPYSGPAVDTAGASVAGSGVAWAVPVPVDVGMTVTNVSFLVGATAASTPTHSLGALYSGTTVTSPPVIGQSTDGGTAALAASTRFDFALTTPTVITSAMAPYGFVYASVAVTATTTLPSVVTLPCGASGTQYRWFTNTPLYFPRRLDLGSVGQHRGR